MKKHLQLGDSKWAFLAFSEKQSVKEKQDILLPQSFTFASVLDFDKCWANFSDLPIVCVVMNANVVQGPYGDYRWLADAIATSVRDSTVALKKCSFSMEIGGEIKKMTGRRVTIFLLSSIYTLQRNYLKDTHLLKQCRVKVYLPYNISPQAEVE